MAKLKRYKYFVITALFLLIASCKSQDQKPEYNYLQNIEEIATDASLNSSNYTLQQGDQIMVLVTARDMEVVKPFNQNYYSSQNSTSPTAGQTSNAPEKMYQVNSAGDIDFPVLGVISTTGKTVEVLKSELTDKISTYVKNPTVTVRLANFKVTVLGEVARPGHYTMAEVNPTVLNAIGLAGDLTMYGKRDNILVVRNTNGQTTKARINLIDGSFINSPYYQMKQGDVIYVSANETKEKIARLNPNTNIYIAVAGTIIGLAGIFITIFKN